MIEGAEITLYLKDGDNLSLDLSPLQLAAIIKLLGLRYDKINDTWGMFSDESLQKLMDKTINKWQPVND